MVSDLHRIRDGGQAAGCKGLNEEGRDAAGHVGVCRSPVRGRAGSARWQAGTIKHGISERERVIEDLQVANGKATVPGVGFGSLGRGVTRMPGRQLGGRPKTA